MYARHLTRIIVCLAGALSVNSTGATEDADDHLAAANAVIASESIAVISVQHTGPEATISIAILPGAAPNGGSVSVELEDAVVVGIDPGHVLSRIGLSGNGFKLRQPALIAYTPSEPLSPLTRAYYVSTDGRMSLLPNQRIDANQLTADLPHASSVAYAVLAAGEFQGSVDAPDLGQGKLTLSDLQSAIETAAQAQQLGLDDFAEGILDELKEALENEIQAELDASPDDAICPENTRKLLEMAALVQQIGTADASQLEAIEHQARSCAASGTVQARFVLQLGGFCRFEETLPKIRFLVAKDGTITGEGDYRLLFHDVDCPIHVEARGRVELSGEVAGFSMGMNLILYTAGLVEMPGPNEETPTIAEWDEDSATLSAQPLFPNLTTTASPGETSLKFSISPEDQFVRMNVSDGVVAVQVWTMKLGCDGKEPPQESPYDCLWQVCYGGEVADVPSELMGVDEIPPQESPDDCLRQVCSGGNVADVPAELMHMEEIPPQVSPNDCLRQVCHNGIVNDVDELTEPGCQ